MSRFELNKVIAYIDGDRATLEQFSADPAGFIAAWEATARTERIAVPHGGRLNDEERRVIVELDYGALYALGAHPYLVIHFARAVEIDARGGDFMTWKEEYRDMVTPHGYPDFWT